MPGSPHLAHSAFAELLLQTVAAQLARALDLRTKLIDHPGSDVGHAYDEEIGEDQPDEKHGGLYSEGGVTGRHHQADDDRHRADRRQRRDQRPTRRGWHHYREEHNPYGDPGESQPPALHLE